MSFKPLSATIDDDPILDGFLIPVSPELVPERKSISVGGYSAPGVLQDCTQAASALPLEYKGQTLEEIVQAAVEPFSIDVDFQADPGPPFQKVKARPTDFILNFLVGLAKQRNIILADNAEGGLVGYQEIAGGVPVALLEEGLGPLIGVTPQINPQQYYSDITGLKPVKPRSKKSIQFTEKNSLLTDVVRPLIFQVQDAKDADIEAAVKSKMGRMFANMLSYSVSVNTWKDPLDQLWQPNTLVKIHAPGAMIYNPYTFLIRSVVLFKGKDTERATLNVVLPGSFSGKVPGSLPWDG
jgi:prophage tail gpP-like protein